MTVETAQFHNHPLEKNFQMGRTVFFWKQFECSNLIYDDRGGMGFLSKGGLLSGIMLI